MVDQHPVDLSWLGLVPAPSVSGSERRRIGKVHAGFAHRTTARVLYTYHVNKLRADTTPEYLAGIYAMAPGLPIVDRNNKSLAGQFIYRFNHSPEHRVMYAVVEFGVQWVFQLIAVSREMDENLTS